jgi:hypothetical protein
VLLNNLATLLSGVRPSVVRLNVAAPSRTTSPLPSLAQVTVQGSFKVSQFAGWLACTICTINNRTKKVNFDLFLSLSSNQCICHCCETRFNNLELVIPELDIRVPHCKA